jgi:hypothetical protein
VLDHQANPTAFTTLNNLKPDSLPTTVGAFLRGLAGPTHIVIPGRDSTRKRALVTLIHGNEPSGLYAVYRLLQQAIQPAVDLHIVLPSIVAAKTYPEFSHRMLPGKRDLNRCFTQNQMPQNEIPDSESQLAQAILILLDELQPEAVIDLHNTSGSGPAFGVVINTDPHVEALVSMFTKRLVVTDLRLGALMEMSEPMRPIVTVECGGSHDHESHQLAFHGLVKFAEADNMFVPNIALPLDIFQHPIRVELEIGTTLSYDDGPDEGSDLTLVKHIEDFNFGIVDEGTLLGFCRPSTLEKLSLKAAQGTKPIEPYFQVVNGELRPRIPLKLFMVTTNITIAQTDCLYYFVTIP